LRFFFVVEKKMKAILACICALIVVCTAAVRDDNTFTPQVPCGFRVDYDSLYEDDESGKSTRTSWIAKYGRYLTTYQEGLVEGRNLKLFAVCRLDMPDPAKPNTAGVFFGMSINGMAMCELEEYSSYDNLYHEMNDDYEYFAEPFEYTSKNDNDEWDGQKCKSYTKSYSYDGAYVTLYVNDKNRVIGVADIDKYENITITKVKYTESAQGKYFRMPKNYPGCDEKLYSNPTTTEEGCKLAPDSESAASTIKVTLFTVFMAVVLFILF